MSVKHKSLAVALAGAAMAAIGTAAPAANAAVPHMATPDINRVGCWTSDFSLEVIQSNYNANDCFENAGGESVTIYNVDDVWTSNNGTYFEVEYKGGLYSCVDPYKFTDSTSECAGVPSGNGVTMVYLSIYPGRLYPPA